ncbi:hypothetical protein GCM10010510_16890 [Streptomyces anandii JCM 4720]|nr:hypothetical protein GCM10010510_16890 [Streptomyces anandii JCM 4720]
MRGEQVCETVPQGGGIVVPRGSVAAMVVRGVVPRVVVVVMVMVRVPVAHVVPLPPREWTLGIHDAIMCV